jgi:hypothetical protein
MYSKVVVEPTIAGIIAMEDEVYQGALKYCKSYLSLCYSFVFLGRKLFLQSWIDFMQVLA